ncbi:hypothetical protein VP1G_06251 [Cytospora mali]|uniref:Uncharacterized protein n=1 Tax=Cytospora mali TaxID=578113 RepID=A0A194V507_CYTMA|nr:hypothetical protein VP1G_06251 [Valsa mali var. pyri (nom. inval.)]
MMSLSYKVQVHLQHPDGGLFKSATANKHSECASDSRPQQHALPAQQSASDETRNHRTPLFQTNGIQTRQQSSFPPAQRDTRSPQAVAHHGHGAVLECPYCNKVNLPLKEDMRCFSCHMRLDSRLASPEVKRGTRWAAVLPTRNTHPQLTLAEVNRPSHQATTIAIARQQRALKHGNHSNSPSTPRPLGSRSFRPTLEVIQWAPRRERERLGHHRRSLTQTLSPSSYPLGGFPRRAVDMAPCIRPANHGSGFARTLPPIHSAHPGYLRQGERPIFRRYPGIGGRGDGVEIGNSYYGFYETQCYLH